MDSQKLGLARVFLIVVTLKLCHSMTATFTYNNSSNLSHSNLTSLCRLVQPPPRVLLTTVTAQKLKFTKTH